MAQQSKGNPASASIPQKEPDLGGALEELKLVAQKPKKIPPETVVQEGFSVISEALRQGYSFTDVTKIFANHGIRISAQELKAQFERMSGKDEE